MTAPKSLQEKYLFAGSPFVQPVFEDILERILKSILEKRSWPQDAVLMELSTWGNIFLRIPFSDTFETFGKRGITILPKDNGEIMYSYVFSLTAINVAIRAFQNGEEQTREYLNEKPSDPDKFFFMNNISDLKRLFSEDKSCKKILNFVAEKHQTRSEFFRLGIEISRNVFPLYLEITRQRMNMAFGVDATARMFSGY